MERRSEAPAPAGTAVLRMLTGGAGQPDHPAVDQRWQWTTEPSRSLPRDGVQVFLLGSDAVARVGLRSLLHGQSDVVVVGDGPPGPATLAALRQLRPAVIVLHRMSGPADMELLARHLGDEVSMVTVDSPEPGPGAEAALALHCGSLPGTVEPAQLGAAVQMAAAGYRMVRRSDGWPAAAPSCRCDDLAPRVPSVSEVDTGELTDREHEVLLLIARGLSNVEIADRLTLSEYTVKSHVRNLLHKLRLRNRVQAVIYAFETGLR
ncbi:response regulator transcription factor [Micromonospora sp. NPDC018662]|uniref:response regulator transcription factor n=1 Tax=Micromonospora sp. NPDC018662 TaxID=3364238 RepID=UPI00379C6336